MGPIIRFGTTYRSEFSTLEDGTDYTFRDNLSVPNSWYLNMGPILRFGITYRSRILDPSRWDRSYVSGLLIGPEFLTREDWTDHMLGHNWSVPNSWPLKMGPILRFGTTLRSHSQGSTNHSRNLRMERIGSPETSVRNYHYLPRNNPEGRSS